MNRDWNELDYQLKNLSGHGENFRSLFADIYDAQSNANEGQKRTKLYDLLSRIRVSMFHLTRRYDEMNYRWKDLVEKQQKRIEELKAASDANIKDIGI